MGYTDVTVVVDGAEADTTTFDEDDVEELDNYVEGIKDLARSANNHVGIYTQYHGHDADIGHSECSCSQYDDNDNTYWQNYSPDDSPVDQEYKDGWAGTYAETRFDA